MYGPEDLPKGFDADTITDCHSRSRLVHSDGCFTKISNYTKYIIYCEKSGYD